MGAKKRARSKTKRRGRNPDLYRVVYLVSARPQRVEGSFTLPQAKAILARLKRRAFEAWIETSAGKFVPVKGTARRPAYFDQHGQIVPMGPLMRKVNPSTMKLEIVDDRKRPLLLASRGQVSGVAIRRLLRERDSIGGAKVAEILDAVAPIYMCQFGGASPGYDCYKQYYDIPDFERQLRKFAVPDGAGWLWTLEEKRRSNPLLPGPPPQYVMGGMGMPEIWRYRGREIEVGPRHGSFVACYDDPVEQMRPCHFGDDFQSALAHARHEIDLSDLPEQWRHAERMIHGVLDHYVDQETGPINRGRIARHIEKQLRYPDPKYLNKLDIRDGSKAFYDLSLPDRLRLIDEVIEEQQILGMFDPKRRASNPDDDAAGTVGELVAW